MLRLRPSQVLFLHKRAHGLQQIFPTLLTPTERCWGDGAGKGLDPAGLGKCLGDRGGIQFSNSMADAGKVGIGYDIWATCTPERDAVTTRIYAPRVGASQCTIRCTAARVTQTPACSLMSRGGGRTTDL